MKYAILVCLLLTGCKTTFFEQQLGDGRIIRAKDTRFMTVTAATIEATINPTNGLITIRVKATSKGDAEFVEAAVAGAARGAAQGAKGGVP